LHALARHDPRRRCRPLIGECQVCLGKVGAVAAREVSRFARNSRDWQQLIEMCRVVDTVLVEPELRMNSSSRLPQR
jgi:hypothetical protein